MLEGVEVGAVSVSDILQVEVVSRCRLVAGSSGLLRSVRSVTVMEVPDVYPWVRSGDMLLTTLYAIKDDPEAISRLIPTLWEKGISALAVKPRRWVQEIPPLMIEQSDQLGFPLIEIPETVSHSVLLEGILQYLVGIPRGKRGDISGYQRVIDRVVDGSELSDVMSVLSSVAGTPVAVFGPSQTDILSERVNDFPSHEAFRATDDIFWQSCPYRDQFEQLARVQTAHTELANRSVKCHQFLSGGGSSSPYRMVVWEWDRALGAEELVMFSQIATLIFFELDKVQAIREVERRYQLQFWQQWMAGEIGSDRSVQQLAWQIGCPIGNAMRQVAVFRMNGEQSEILRPAINREKRNAFPSRPDPVSDLGQWIGEWLKHQQIDGLWFPLEEAVVVTTTVSSGVTCQSDQWVNGLLHDARTVGQRELFAGIGRPYPLHQQHLSYREALQASTLSHFIGSAESFARYDNLGIYRLLGALQDSPELTSFVDDYVGPLRKYDHQYNASLLKTVQHYLDNGCNVRRASKEMFVHYNTVVYRLNQVESVCGRSLDDPNFRLALYVALKASHFS